MLRLACIVAFVSSACAPSLCAPALTPPEGWMFGAGRTGAFECGLDFDVVHTGRSSAYIRFTPEYPDEGIGGGAMLSQFLSAEHCRGKRIRCSGWLKTENVQGWGAQIWMRVSRADGSEVATDDMGSRPTIGTSGWQQHSVVLDVGRDAATVAFGLVLAGTGRVWADTFAFEEVPQDVPVTGRPKEGGRHSESPANPDFESPAVAAPTGVPSQESVEGWDLGPASPGACEYQLDSRIFHSGRSSVRIHAMPEYRQGTNSLSQWIAADSYRGKRVCYSGWLKTDEVQGDGARLTMQVNTRDRLGSAVDNMDNRPVKGTSDWRQYSVVLDIPRDAAAFRLGVALMGPGCMWVDTLKLEEVGPDVPVTGLPGEGWQPPKAPANLDMELMPPQH